MKAKLLGSSPGDLTVTGRSPDLMTVAQPSSKGAATFCIGDLLEIFLCFYISIHSFVVCGDQSEEVIVAEWAR